MENMVYWPDDIIFVILTKLPPKHLLRFKTLSKSWEETTNSHSFHREMVSRLRANSGNEVPGVLLFSDHDSDMIMVPTSLDQAEVSVPLIDIQKEIGFLEYVGTCNGVIAFSIWGNSKTCSGLILWNPLKKKDFIKLEPPPLLPQFQKEKTVFGWSFSSVTKEFKLFRIACDFWNTTQVYVCNIRANHREWIELESATTPDLISIHDKYSITVHECVTWICQRETLANNFLLYLNVSTEELGLVGLPVNICNSMPYDLRIGEVKGSICVLRQDNEDGEVWVIQDHLFESWAILYKFKSSADLGYWFNSGKVIVAEGEDTMVIRRWQKFILYHLRDNTLRQRPLDFPLGTTFPFAAGLISPTFLSGGDYVDEGSSSSTSEGGTSGKDDVDEGSSFFSTSDGGTSAEEEAAAVVVG